MVATSELTNSATYVDLATVGPSVTMTTGTTAIVRWTAVLTETGASNVTGFVSCAVSGATTVAASDNNSGQGSSPASSNRVTAAHLMQFTGLTPGSNTFTLKYRATGGSMSFLNRAIAVQTP